MRILTENKNENKPWFLYNANLRTKTLVITIVACLILISVFLSNFFIDASSLTTNFGYINQPPSFEHWFGTDWMGRDMFTRTILGLGLSIGVGAFASAISTVVAIVLGVLSSVNDVADEFVAALIDLFGSIPHILLIILVSISFGGGYYGVIMGVGLTHWTPLARILRAEIKKIKTTEFVKLSYELGRSKWFVAKKHILPLVIFSLLYLEFLQF